MGYHVIVVICFVTITWKYDIVYVSGGIETLCMRATPLLDIWLENQRQFRFPWSNLTGFPFHSACFVMRASFCRAPVIYQSRGLVVSSPYVVRVWSVSGMRRASSTVDVRMSRAFVGGAVFLSPSPDTECQATHVPAQ